MKTCCFRSFANRNLRTAGRPNRLDEGHRCESCGQLYRYTRAHQWEPHDAPTVDTVNIYSDADGDTIDFGWARATRDRDRHLIFVQCWGCGAVHEMPDNEQFSQMHFQHAAGNCSEHLARRNKKRGVMPGARH
jgi:hypothetical protein